MDIHKVSGEFAYPNNGQTLFVDLCLEALMPFGSPSIPFFITESLEEPRFAQRRQIKLLQDDLVPELNRGLRKGRKNQLRIVYLMTLNS
jgi:hypothetical protein